MVQTSSSQSSEELTHSGDDKGAGGIAVACAVCGATFTFSPTAQNLDLSARTLEAVFMSVCHYCFRCRRLACPECWDSLHGLCGACVREVRLPFRSAPAPLGGAELFSVRKEAIPPPANPSSSALLCVRPGHFESVQNAESAQLPAASSSIEPSSNPANPSQPLMFPVRSHSASSQKAVYYIPLVPLDAKNRAAEEEQAAVRPFVRFINIAEQLVTTIAFGTLLVCAVLIVLAALSAAANQQIIRLVHIDIRGEIAYLTYLVRQLHW
jgi:hypothetical protein